MSCQACKESEESDRSLVSLEGRSRWELNLACLRYLPGSCAGALTSPTRFVGPAARISAHEAYSAFEPGQLTAIPLAYGVCCAAIDLCLAAYFCGRHSESIAAWRRFHSEDGYLIGSR